jgi:hypothetical protein
MERDQMELCAAIQYGDTAYIVRHGAVDLPSCVRDTKWLQNLSSGSCCERWEVCVLQNVALSRCVVTVFSTSSWCPFCV